METATAERDLFDTATQPAPMDDPMLDRNDIDDRDTGILANPAPAHTRMADPATSFAAAASVKPEKTREIYKTILLILGEHGPSTDPEIERFVESGAQSPSGLRTRRKELQVAGYIEYAGYKRKLASGLYGQAWALTAKGASVYQHWTGNVALVTDGKAGEG